MREAIGTKGTSGIYNPLVPIHKNNLRSDNVREE